MMLWFEHNIVIENTQVRATPGQGYLNVKQKVRVSIY